MCAFYDIIREHVEGAISSVLPLDQFKTIIADNPVVPKQQRNRWFFITYNVMHDMLRFGKCLGLTEKIDFVFDQQTRGWPQIFDAWDSFSKHAPINRNMIGGSPRFEDDKGLPPLQAADFLAWVIRRKAGRAFRKEAPEPFFWEREDHVAPPYQRLDRKWLPKDLAEFVQRNGAATTG